MTLPEPKKGKKLNQFEEFMLKAKKEFTDNRTFPKIDVNKLNEKQTKVYDIVKSHIENPRQCLRLIVQGAGGNGKLHVF